MLKNYFKSIFRGLTKDTTSLFINLLGLAVSFAGFLLIIQYGVYEMSYDQHFENSRNVYRVALEGYQSGQLEVERATTYPGLGPALKSEFSTVENTVRLRPVTAVIQKDNIRFIEAQLYAADPSVFEVFGFKLTDGRETRALQDVGSVVLSRSTAKKYFGDESPVGKSLTLRVGAVSEELVVTGLYDDFPQNSHIRPELMLSYNTTKGLPVEPEDSWENSTAYTYVSINGDARPMQLENEFSSLFMKYKGSKLAETNTEERVRLQPVESIHLYSDLENEASINGNGDLVNYLLIIGFFILVIAWINYVNLATARAMRRVKEIGIRKAIGAHKSQLFFQYLIEAGMINFFAIVVALLLTFFIMTQAGDLIDIALPPVGETWVQPWFWGAVFLLWLLGTVSSGFYPSLVLSRFNPVVALKGKARFSTGRFSFRKALMVFQFTISVMMLVGVIAVYSQIRYMANKDLGIEIDKTLVIKAPAYVPDSEEYQRKIETLKTEVIDLPGVRAFSATGAVPGSETYTVGGMIRPVDAPVDEVSTYSLVWVDYDFIEAFKVNMVAGRNFSRDYGTDYHAVVVNEAAARQLGYENPQDAVGTRISAYGEQEIIGVAKNYHQQYLKKDFVPIIFYLNNSSNIFYSLKLDDQADMNELVADVRSTYEQIFPSNAFDYFFLDDFFKTQYRADRQFGQLFGFFTLLAIIIACTGLYGLSSFMVAQRTKEICVRKVIGASRSNIIQLITKDYLIMVIISSLIAWPIAYYGISNWLDDYAFRIQIGWLLFFMPTIVVLVVVLLTISFQTLKTSSANPVKYLKYE
ncbi:ABC transporter permease [Roseivirga sp. BDSF3-8]|uniref:ABC transporter permease n=1 Tax=Roseivirga sp. BDSF3-8 TaxID=3241598 RepID=UPI003531CB7E